MAVTIYHLGEILILIGGLGALVGTLLFVWVFRDQDRHERRYQEREKAILAHAAKVRHMKEWPRA